jgi:hypothetical protein
MFSIWKFSVRYRRGGAESVRAWNELEASSTLDGFAVAEEFAGARANEVAGRR